MKFLEGKTPIERNKTIAAIVLGFLAIVAIGYNLLPAAPRKSKVSNANSNARVVTTNSGANSNLSEQQQLPTVDQTLNEPYADLEPIPEDPFPPIFGGATSRNIFAIYVPPVIIPSPPLPSPIPAPSAVPTPPILVQFVSSNPNQVYAGQNNFTLDVSGDKFTPDAKVLFNGQELSTQFGGAQRLTAQVPAALITTEGQKQIIVRTSDGSKISNPMIFNVQTPPVPNYNFVGLVARKRYNNDTALLQERQSKEYKNVRLGEAVGRFKVVSISSKEVVMQDTALSFRHNIPFMDEKSVGKTGGASSAGRQNNDPGNNGFPQGFDPNVQIQYQQVPGIPNQYTQAPQMQQMQPMNPMPPPAPAPTQKKNPDDDEDEDN